MKLNLKHDLDRFLSQKENQNYIPDKYCVSQLMLHPVSGREHPIFLVFEINSSHTSAAQISILTPRTIGFHMHANSGRNETNESN